MSKIYALLPFNSYFIGCFVDNKIRNGFSDKYRNFPQQTQYRKDAYENGIESRIPFISRMYSFLDFRTNMYLTAKSVTRLFDESGLHLVEMTDINGLTYFCTRKVKLIA
ncbi:MAG: hypothetical protein E4G92_00555 [Bacteroidia bacterium]|nr:MAG: hypothetical protein E4G92_00555 [Bacteroidia bacterium]